MAARSRILRASSAQAYGHSEVVRAAGRLVAWAQEAPERRPADEYIHELRVRLRRARAAMRSFRRFYRTRAEFERRVDRLRRLSRALGPLRDADVTAELLADALKTSPHKPAAVASMISRHERSRERRWFAVRPALLAIASLPPEAFAPPMPSTRPGKPPAGRRLDRHARRTLEGRFDEVWALRGALKSGDPLELHALRIQIKRLRYSIESFDAIMGVAGRRWRETLRGLQATLGAINDHTVGLALLERYVQRERRPLEAASLRRLAATVRAHREWLIAQFAIEWRKANPARLRAQLRAL